MALALFPTAPARSQQPAPPFQSPSPQAAAAPEYPDTTEGLEDLLSEIGEAEKRKDVYGLAQMADYLQIPNYENWFTETFGADKGKAWADAYAISREKNGNDPQQNLPSIPVTGGEFVIRKTNGAPRPGPGLEPDMLAAMKVPVDIYFVAWKLADLPDNSQPAPLGYFVFIDGKFRWDSGVTLADILGPVAKASEGGPFLPGVLGVGYPKCLACPRPAFSPEARAVSLQGTVLLTVVVQANGQAGFIKVVKSVGMGLDESAVQAIRNWRFQAALDSNGTPVSVITQIEVTYRLTPRKSPAVSPPNPPNN